MQISKKMLLTLVIGSAVVGSMVSVAAQTGDSNDPSASPAPRAMGFMMRGHGGPGGPKGPAIRSISVLPPTEEGGKYRTVRTDQGELTAVDGDSLTIKEQDGTVVQVSVQDDTRISREREEAELSDLKEGDHVHSFRIKEGDGAYETEFVGAMSKQTYEKMEAQREACRADPSSENCPRRGPGFGHFGPGGPGSVQRAPFPAQPGAEAPAA